MSHPEQEQPRKVCLFGGTFDPIHLGHLHIAGIAAKELSLDQVTFLPCRQSPHKQGQDHAADHHRLAMCQLATADLPWAAVDDFDLTAPPPSYSWRTADAMKARFPKATLYWLMGTDQWHALPKWNRVDHLASLVEFIVFTRGEKPQPRDGFTMHAIDGHHPASATAIRKHLREPRHKQSASCPHHWIPPEVLCYITEHELYAEPTNPKAHS